jgi:hypothetical protein
MNSINDFDVIEINSVLKECHFSLSGWLLESLARFASTILISAISALANSIAAVSSSSHDSTPDKIVFIVNDRNAKAL